MQQVVTQRTPIKHTKSITKSIMKMYAQQGTVVCMPARF